jgi:argininosuccinate synthase
MQAQQIALMARKLGTNSIAHGCTAAGNDQVRFEVAMRTLAPELEVIAPVRDKAFKRQEELDYLNARKLPLPPYGAAYSINRGLWGVTIGGKETLTSEGSIPDSAWVLSKDAFTNPRAPAKHTVEFEKGRPRRPRRQEAVGRGNRRAARVARRALRHRPRHPPRRHHHRHQGPRRVRSARRRSAAHGASRARKLVLTPRQQRIKDSLAGPYGDWVHEGQLLDPVCRDIEALLLSSQERVTGKVHVLFRPGSLFIEGVESKYSLMAASKGVYGESHGEWTPQDALGFSKIVSLTGMFHARAGGK